VSCLVRSELHNENGFSLVIFFCIFRPRFYFKEVSEFHTCLDNYLYTVSFYCFKDSCSLSVNFRDSHVINFS